MLCGNKTHKLIKEHLSEINEIVDTQQIDSLCACTHPARIYDAAASAHASGANTNMSVDLGHRNISKCLVWYH
ncbi:uncharacterized protein Hqrw_2167 [Haloquadratum walsbyi C23]|uniref:Uncharacterized protein n=2 Tax=Haloquadratum walsbyi TaxID=293091 RepID=Q18IN8_HALWD|nr:uncharacterized protein HQ_2003A [Haloquadratum walsbyi DSM 16790]CCC40063.1 uncharacterized protein Hqrw_2167 [Haloquadratum walsbyi C23]